MPGLRADAPEFFPASWGQMSFHQSSGAEEQQADDYLSEVSISEEELAELEAVDEWVERMVELELDEEEHLKATALAEAPPEAILVVEQRAKAAAKGRPAGKAQ